MYRLPKLSEGASFMVVGCGGTGGFVAEGLCRMLAGKKNDIDLIDHDRVEEKNLGRQNFRRSELGQFKSRALAERLSQQYGVTIIYSVSPVENLPANERGMVTIGCVDNPEARRSLEVTGHQMLGQAVSYAYFEGWYIDAGNGEYSGQVLIGNELAKRRFRKTFLPNEGICQKLPLPTVQEPGLLLPVPKKRADCAEAVAAEEQSPVINQAMANLVLTFVHKLMLGTLDWMQAYIDLEKGSLTTVPITPEAVGRITGLMVKELEYRPRRKNE